LASPFDVGDGLGSLTEAVLRHVLFLRCNNGGVQFWRTHLRSFCSRASMLYSARGRCHTTSLLLLLLLPIHVLPLLSTPTLATTLPSINNVSCRQTSLSTLNMTVCRVATNRRHSMPPCERKICHDTSDLATSHDHSSFPIPHPDHSHHHHHHHHHHHCCCCC